MVTLKTFDEVEQFVFENKTDFTDNCKRCKPKLANTRAGTPAERAAKKAVEKLLSKTKTTKH